MTYRSSKEIAEVLSMLHAQMKFASGAQKMVLLSHEELRILAGRSALRTAILRSVSNHLSAHKLYLFHSKDFYLLVPWGHPSRWRGPTPSLLKRLAAPTA